MRFPAKVAFLATLFITWAFLLPTAALAIKPVAPGAEAATTASAASGDRLFFKATEAYEKGDFSAAAQGFSALLAAGQEGAGIWYNLGNSYYRSGQNGAALWAFKEASRLAPRWDNLEANLALLKLKAIDELPPLHATWQRTIFFWHYVFSFKERLILLAIFNALFWALLIISARKKSDLLSMATIFALAFTLAFGASLVKEQFFTTPEGVVKTPSVTVRSAGLSTAQALFELHECTELFVEEEQNGWLLISLSDGKRGWVNEEAIAWRR